MPDVLTSLATLALGWLNGPVHQKYFPFPWFTTLHGLRISLIYQTNARTSSSWDMMSWTVYIAGYLMMCWGGALVNHGLVSLPAPQLYSFKPYINYLVPHLTSTYILHQFMYSKSGKDKAKTNKLVTLDARTLDTFLIILDGLIRANAVVAGISVLPLSVFPTSPFHAQTSSPHYKALHDSILAPLIFGAIASSGGGVLASVLGTWTAEWGKATWTPGWMKLGSGWSGKVDVLGGSLAAVFYLGQCDSKWVAASGLPSLINEKTLQAWGIGSTDPITAKSRVALMFIGLFGWRTYVTHWRASPVRVSSKNKPKKE